MAIAEVEFGIVIGRCGVLLLALAKALLIYR